MKAIWKEKMGLGDEKVEAFEGNSLKKVWRFPEVRLPLYLIVENHAVGCIFGCKGFCLILHAEHHEWFCTVVANRALAGWCYSHHASLLNREYLAIYLELALAAEEEIQFLVVLVGVEESCLCARSKALE